MGRSAYYQKGPGAPMARTVQRKTLNLRVPVLLMALIVALAMVPGEFGDAVRAFGGVVADGIDQLERGYGRLFA